MKFFPQDSELETSTGHTFGIKKQGKLYYLNNIKTAKSSQRSLTEWHRILGHCNTQDVLSLESVVNGMTLCDKSKFNCEVCIKGKIVQTRNRNADKRATQPLELVHCDLAGPITPAGDGDYKYAASFVNDYSSFNIVYLIKSKSDALAALKKFLADSAPYGTIKRLRSDNGTEFTNNQFESLLIENKIKHEFSSPHSPHQNGTVERGWRSLFEMARCMLIESDLPKKMWPYAVKTAAYTRNRCFNSRTKKTPYEMCTSIKPDISNMHIFGSRCFAYVQNKTKLNARSELCKFIGYDGKSPAYIVYFSESDEIKRIRCVKFLDEPNYDVDIIYDNGVVSFLKPQPSEVQIEN